MNLNIAILEHMNLPEKERAQTRIPMVWKEPIPEEITEALKEISRGKCTFCEERRADISPYRFRPPAYAAPNDGSLLEDTNYLWTCWDWNNFYSICPDCLPVEKNLFPLVTGGRVQPDPREFSSYMTNLKISGLKKGMAPLPNFLAAFEKERPFLIAPRKFNDMARNFSASPSGMLHGTRNNKRSQFTIDHFKLNRPGLVDRRNSFADNQIHKIHNALNGISEIPSPEWYDIFDFKAGNYSTYFYLLLRNIAMKAFPDLKDKKQLRPGLIRSLYESTVNTKNAKAVTSSIENYYFMWDSIQDRAEYAMRGASLRKTTSSAPIKSDEEKKQALEALEKQICYKNYPRLKSISVKNFKSLEKVSLELPEEIERLEALQSDTSGNQPEAPCLILLGENATGKSSLLEAVCLAVIPDDMREVLDEKAERIILNPVYMGSAKETKIRQSDVKLDFFASEDKQHPEQLALTINAGGFNSALKPAGITRPLIFAYGAHRLFGNVESDTPDLANIITLFKNDQAIRNPEKWLIKQYKKDSNIFDAIVASLRLVIQVDGKFEDISVEDDETGKPYCQINLKRSERILNSVTPDAEDTEKNSYTLPLRFSVASSGYKVILGLLCDIFAGIMAETKCAARDVHTYPAIVLIDEVEAHLHPRWKMQVINGLRKALPKVTFLISSHDPLCVRGSYTGEVAVLNRYTNLASQTRKSTLREAVEVITDLPNLGNFTVDQLLTSDLFSMFSSDDIRTEKTLAIVADKIVELKKDRDNANGDAPLEADELQTRLDAEEKKVFEDFQKNIAEALPIGNDEVARLVQEAVAEFLVKRRNLDSTQEREARKKAKAAIIKHLEAFIS